MPWKESVYMSNKLFISTHNWPLWGRGNQATNTFGLPKYRHFNFYFLNRTNYLNEPSDINLMM